MKADEASLLDFLKPYKFDTTFRENGAHVEHTYGGEGVVMGMSDGEEAEDRSTELWINIEPSIGSGGFGSVWLQLQKEAPSGINRRARAVKRLDRGRTKSAIFLRELRSMIVVRDASKHNSSPAIVSHYVQILIPRLVRTHCEMFRLVRRPVFLFYRDGICRTWRFEPTSHEFDTKTGARADQRNHLPDSQRARGSSR
jgi:hypothetical protein